MSLPMTTTHHASPTGRTTRNHPFAPDVLLPEQFHGPESAAAKSSGSAAVRIVGHTDTSGSATYNQKLSECRANAAKTNLVGKGVSEGSISTSGKGEAELMVQTGDGVKEPQNRRATVDLQ